MKAFNFIAELLPLTIAVLCVAYLIREHPQGQNKDEPPILPPEDWSEEYAREFEEEIRRDRQTRKERRRKP